MLRVIDEDQIKGKSLFRPKFKEEPFWRIKDKNPSRELRLILYHYTLATSGVLMWNKNELMSYINCSCCVYLDDICFSIGFVWCCSIN